MLTFLRKVRKSLIESGSTQKYLIYAIGEIALVVIGILIALQINNWNEWRKDRVLEKLLLAEINSEFQENKKQFERGDSAHRQAYSSTLDLMEYFPIQLETHIVDSVILKLRLSLERYTFNPSQGTILSMLNNSTFEVIRDEELRKLLISWNDWVKDYQENETQKMFHTRTFLVPILSKNLNFRDTSDGRINWEALKTLEFENVIRQRSIFLSDLIEGEDYDRVHYAIHRIIELTQTFE